MESCDVLIAGGGPGGSTYAWKLSARGLSVVAADRATFPRDNVCAGWLTPQVLIVDRDGALLVGDAAGVARVRSGEGIRAAVESGLLAASTILRARGEYTHDRLGVYEARLRAIRARRGLASIVKNAAVDAAAAPWQPPSAVACIRSACVLDRSVSSRDRAGAFFDPAVGADLRRPRGDP
jgi:flavin-dependent dehydrogenase